MKILSVTPKRNHRGDWWLIITDDPAQPKVSTDSMFAASFAEEAKKQNLDVTMLSSSGWYYRSLLKISTVKGLPPEVLTYRVHEDDPHTGGC